MTIIEKAAPARTDLAAAAPQPTITASGVRKAGAALAAGALIWAGEIFVFGANPGTEPGTTLGDLLAIPFQLGIFALLTVQLRTRATGTTRFSTGMLKVEYVLLALATLWSLLHGLFPAFRDDAWLAVLDIFWPLSMLGMFIISIKLFFARRWRGLGRGWPLVAESWAIVTVPMFGIFGSAVADPVGATHLIIGYATLGLMLMTKPEVTGVRR